MVELADTHGSGPCDRKVVEVQILLGAPINSFICAGFERRSNILPVGKIVRRWLARAERRRGKRQSQILLRAPLRKLQD